MRSNDLDDQPFDDTIAVELTNHTYLNEAVSLSPGPYRVPVKIDVEGHELNALGALAAWRGWASVFAVLVELDQTFADTLPVRTLLQTHGFTERRRQGAPDHYDALFTRPLSHG